MAKRDKYDPLYNDYVTAKKRAWEESRIRLTEGDFLRTIDPQTNWSDKQAEYYFEKLKAGEWTSANVTRRSSATAGRVHRLLLKDRSGRVVKSTSGMLPGGQSLLRAYMSGAMQQAARAYLDEIYPRDAEDDDEEGDPMAGLIIAGTVVSPTPRGRTAQWIGGKPSRRGAGR